MFGLGRKKKFVEIYEFRHLDSRQTGNFVVYC